MAKILLIEDDPTFVMTLEGYLGKLGHTVESAARAEPGMGKIEKGDFDLILLDYRLPDATGADVLEFINKKGRRDPVIVMTSFSDLQTAVKLMRMGAKDYITKPVNPEELKMRIDDVLRKAKESPKEMSPVKDSTNRSQQNEIVMGESEISKRLQEMISLVAPTQLTTIILGESGTGKEIVARTIHEESTRSDKPFVAVDCGALTDELSASELFGHVKGAFTGAVTDKQGQFLEADGGTLFLDEVGNLAYEVQVKLLRALQEQEVQPLGSSKTTKVDVRILTATNESLQSMVEKGSFREDLYHRLNEFRIEVPPLRERHQDLAQFMRFFRERANEELNRKTTRFSDQVVSIFKSYSWPGNIRELKNVVRRAVLLTPEEGEIKTIALPPEMKKANESSTPAASEYDLKAQQANSERETILKTLEEARYNKSKAARMLNIDRKTLYLKMEKYNIET
ncbi:sigma-54-dependent transcriptional regulator [Halocola ammonii]